MRRLLARSQPNFKCILLIESGPRKVTEEILPYLYNVKGAQRIDVLTSYSTPPAAFNFDRGDVYSVHDEEARLNRGAFLRKLASGPYTVLGLLCTGSPILKEWKWRLASRSSARLIVVNDQAKYFGLDIWNLKTARFMLYKWLTSSDRAWGKRPRHRFLTRAQPNFDSILLIESGPRRVTEEILLYFYTVKTARRVDILTCYDTPPAGFDFDRGTVHSVHHEDARRNRSEFLRTLASGPYTAVSLLCTGSPILEKWKWMLAFRSSAKLIVVNEEANYFSLDIWNLKTARLMLLKRLNPFADYSSAGLLTSLTANLAGLLFAPFTVTYLLFYTAVLHVRRWLRARNPLAS